MESLGDRGDRGVLAVLCVRLDLTDEETFALLNLLVDTIEADRYPMSLDGWLFFDRGLIDPAAALQHLTGEPAANRYHRRVFLTPPWPEIYRTDPERRHGLDMALAEYSRLLKIYPSLGYEVSILPKVGVEERADFVLRTLET